MADERYYTFNIVFYNSIDVVKEFTRLTKHYCYILHDKDPQSPHYHMIATFTKNKSVNSVFDAIKKCKVIHGDEQNAFVEYTAEVCGAYDYLTHKNAPEKFQYSADDIVHSSIPYWKNRVTTAFSEDRKQEETGELLRDLFNLNHLQLAMRYGRDYIINCKKYQEFKKILVEEIDIEELRRFIDYENNNV